MALASVTRLGTVFSQKRRKTCANGYTTFPLHEITTVVTPNRVARTFDKVTFPFHSTRPLR